MQRVRSIPVLLMLCALATHAARAQQPQPLTLPTDAELKSMLAARVDTMKKAVGMVVGIVSLQGRRVVAYGRTSQTENRPVDGNTVFEIGSVTKVFTSLLLTDMVRRREIKLTDSIGGLLPRTLKLKRFEGKAVTLADLATNTSGYPALPPDFPVRLPTEYSKYTDVQMMQFLRGFQPKTAPGAVWEYSNLGNTLLGRALANRLRLDYSEAIGTRITKQLGMTSTALVPTADMRKRLAAPHDATLKRAPEWNVPSLEPATSLRSTANDLLTLLEAFMSLKTTPLAGAMRDMLVTKRPAPNLTQALGWWIIPFGAGDEGLVTQSGETFGFSCTVAFDPKAHVGVVVLSNSSQDDDGLAWHLLRPSYPYTPVALEKGRDVKVASAILDRYVGEYQPLTGGVPISIERQADALIFKSSVLPQGVRLRAQDDKTFLMTEADMRIVFEADGTAKAKAIVVRFSGTDTRAVRVP